MTDEIYVTIQDLMRKLDVSNPTALRWLSEGVFPGAYKEPGRTGAWRIPLAEIDAKRDAMVYELNNQIAHLLSLE
jgi:predicted DNA-binding transcriptional regulator AlpA